MPSEHAEIARRGIEAYNRRDFDAIAELLTEDVVSVVPDGMANAGAYHGYEGFRRMTRHWDEAWDDFQIEIQELIEEGDAVIVPVVHYGRGRGSGIETNMTAVHLMRFRGGRMYRWRLCMTRDEAFRHSRD